MKNSIEVDQPDTPSPTRKVDLIRFMPQPSLSGDISLVGSKALTLNVEDELFLFMNSVMFNSARAALSLDGFPAGLSCYTFEPNPNVFSSGLVVSLTKCVQKYVNTKSRDAPVSRALSAKALLAAQQYDVTPNFSSACKNLSLLLHSYVSNPDNGRSHQSGVNVRLKSIGSGLNSVENILIVMVSVYLYLLVWHRLLPNLACDESKIMCLFTLLLLVGYSVAGFDGVRAQPRGGRRRQHTAL